MFTVPADATMAWPIVLAAAVVVALVSWGLWNALNDTLAKAKPDQGIVWVPLVAMAVAGGLWGAVSKGRSQGLRIGVGIVAGAAVGAVGALFAGKAKVHVDAQGTGAIDLGHIVLWAVLGAAAWAITLGAASSPAQRRSTMIGASVGGAASGGLMGALLGHFVNGSPPEVTPTDFWWSIPLKEADVGARVIPVLLIGIVVPMLCALPARRMSPVLLRAGAAVVVLAVVGVAFVHNTSNASTTAIGPASPIPKDQRGTKPARPDDTGPDITRPKSKGRDSSTRAVTAADGTAPDATAPNVTVPDAAAPTNDTEVIETVAPPVTAVAAPPVAVETTPVPDTPTPRDTVPFKFDTGFPVYAAYDGTASNSAIETAAVKIAFGPPIVADSAMPNSVGTVVCTVGPNDAVFPFLIDVSARGLTDSTKLRVAFGQGGIQGADPAAHPVSVQWNYAGGRQCLPGTALATAPDAAPSTWSTPKDGSDQSGFGYLVVKDYFDPATGAVVAAPSAGIAVSVTINDDVGTRSEWTLAGGSIGVVDDPTYGQYGAVLFG